MHQRTKGLFLLLLLALLISKVTAQNVDPPFLKYINHPWVDSVMNTLSEEERVAQLIWVAAFSNRDISHEVYLSDLIKKTGIGGVIFFQDNAPKQSEMINYFRKISKVPLMVVTDGEWGIGMRLEGIIKFPFQMTLGAIGNDSLIYLMGRAVADQFRRAGVQINLAPVADVDNNPQNPVINFRSFGEDPENVSRKSLMYMRGLQDNGIIAVAKHFPGHGDTEVDSHLDLPVLRHSRARFDSIELVPFKSLINNGITGVMPGHLWIPNLDPNPNLPSTISYPVLTGLLKNELSFKGLVLSDAMNMEGITKYTKPGEAEVNALKAGMDVLEYVTDPERAIKTIIDCIKTGEITTELINEKCRKVLAAKYWAGLSKPAPIAVDNIMKELSPTSADALIRDLYANALTVLNNKQNVIPVRNLDKLKIATLAINDGGMTPYQVRISKYTKVDNYFIDTIDQKKVTRLLKKLEKYDLVIAGVFNTDQRSVMNFGIPEGLDSLLEKLNSVNKCIITYFGNPYSIAKISSLQNTDGLIVAYQENEYTEDLSAQLIFGGIGARGSLPVTINENWPFNFGIITPGNIRLQYGLPESVGMSSEILNRKIDSIVNIGLQTKAFPGCEVMAARKGIVVFKKTYGYQTYDNRVSVQEDDLYDLASVTKVSATLPGLMLLDAEGKFSPDETLGYYLPYFKKSNKNDLLMKDMLTHQSGLTAWLPFWKETVEKDGKFRRNIFNSEYEKKFPLEVAPGLYINKNYRKKMFTEIKKSPIGVKKYVYSDITFIIAPEIVEKLSGQKWYDFVTTNIYQKIGAFDIGFNPYLKYPLSRIVPTEYDSLFRKQLLHGTVHDEGAAMLGGISGHAGLFATANDLMKLMELYRRMGEYGGEQLIGKDVMEEYTRVQFPENNNRRGLGFDKPLLNNSELTQKEAYPTKSASPESFGHSGFTGTFVWIDPVYDITYVFLCNRVYPTRNNNLLSDLNIRSEILQAIYDSIKE
ncbi:MAG: glycoside hydrolase family 3 N-terminal domain-containing protein [Bacteroidales bacterium]|nr:glycoside hydrolase family 3 N-terminal domain-containing protein [Bacteroidales bacterium]